MYVLSTDSVRWRFYNVKCHPPTTNIVVNVVAVSAAVLLVLLYHTRITFHFQQFLKACLGWSNPGGAWHLRGVVPLSSPSSLVLSSTQRAGVFFFQIYLAIKVEVTKLKGPQRPVSNRHSLDKVTNKR